MIMKKLLFKKVVTPPTVVLWWNHNKMFDRRYQHTLYSSRASTSVTPTHSNFLPMPHVPQRGTSTQQLQRVVCLHNDAQFITNVLIEPLELENVKLLPLKLNHVQARTHQKNAYGAQPYTTSANIQFVSFVIYVDLLLQRSERGWQSLRVSCHYTRYHP